MEMDSRESKNNIFFGRYSLQFQKEEKVHDKKAEGTANQLKVPVQEPKTVGNQKSWSNVKGKPQNNITDGKNCPV